LVQAACQRAASPEMKLRTASLAVIYGMLSLTPPAVPAEEPSPLPQAAEQEPEGRLYRTNAERREVGLKRQLTPWLAASGLLELEGLRESFKLRGDGKNDHETNTAATLQIGLTASPWEPVTGDLLLEYDTESDKLVADEVIAGMEWGPWELEVGRQYLPFGVYFSHFATGPLIEFGETRATGATVSYGPDDRLDFSASVYDGRARKEGNGSGALSWAIAMEAWPKETLSFGLSYLSNLADADSRLLSDEKDRYLRKVPGLSGYLVWTRPTFEVTFEALGAVRSFRELERDRAQPAAWNLEFVHFTHSSFEWALRVEGSQELEDEPELQLGAALTWRTGRQASLTLEYLHGRFQHDLATNDDDQPYDRVNRLGAQLSLAF